eukprot:TRINITY_DN8866_c0_g1_i1.p1 TRINITY_DN8866_c0_g1~~TRINITY_DN8866_c0_g1_i1.p1  ORF type:complete len:217 (-),score=74.99 TRINITY_DN8866_c0_g1_i1:191-841(-)
MASSDASTLDARYKEANRLLLESRDQLEQIETGMETTIQVESKISTNLNSLSRLSELLETQIDSQPPAKKELWRIRVKQLSDECRSLRSSLSNYLQERYKKTKQEEERNQLFERRTAKAGGGSNLATIQKEGDSLETSIHMVSDLQQSGMAILEGINSQNDLIRNIQKKVYDVGISIGLSKSVMRVIERKIFVDRLIIYGGMVLTLIFIFVLWYYI